MTDQPAPEDAICFAGLDGATGLPLYPPLAAAEAAELARRHPPDRQRTAEAEHLRRHRLTPGLGPRYGIDPKDLAATGWGVVFPAGADPAVAEALAPLLEHRRAQAAARRERYFRCFAGEDGYQPGETKTAFLARHGMGPGLADPEKVPYYLLLAGGPDEIPWEVQQQLALQYAVGRVAFETPEEYAGYAASVVAAEAAPAPPAREAVFFGVENPDDEATRLMGKYLLAALPAFLGGRAAGWTVRTLRGAEATKERLARLLGGEETPAFLFTTSHGMGFPKDDPRQRRHQGALVCGEWQGPKRSPGPIPEAAYFSADDLAADAAPGALVAFHYACHGAGVPALDAYPERAGTRRALAAQPFVARLPQRLLSRPRGGALAVIGHVERAFCWSFLWDGAGGQTQTFEDLLLALLDGLPVGAALEPLALRYGEIAAALTQEIQESRFAAAAGEPPDAARLSRLWTAYNDARSYALLGDPAVRLR